MSIAVPLDELAEALAQRPWGYLLTVRDDGRAQTLALPTVWRDGALVGEIGRSTAANVVARPTVTWVFPGASGEEFSLIVDGDASVVGESVEGSTVVVRPTWAVLHRPALRPD
jgi:hypothetical protein